MRIFLVLGLVLVSQWVNAADSHPQEIVKNTANQVISQLKLAGKDVFNDEGRLYSLINQHILPHFDFEKMSRSALGRHWAKASPAQRQAFIKEYKTMLVRTYASSLSEYADKPIVYLPFRGDLSTGKAEIRSEVEIPGSFPVPIGYRMHKLNEKWLVYDVTIDEISLIANYRTTFAQEIRKNGLDKLIADLATKNSQQ